MILLSDFLKKVLLDIFKYPKNSEKYIKFGVSRNAFAYYMDYNNATKLGGDCKNALKKLILSEIKNANSKEYELISFFRPFLTKTELEKYNNKQIINSVIDKFSEKSNLNHMHTSFEFEKENSAKNIKKMFESTIKYFDTDPFTALMYSEKISTKIINDIKNFERIVSKNKNIIKLLNQREKIPSDIEFSINSIINVNSVILNSSDSSKMRIYKSTKLNIINIVEWYLNEYLNIYKYRIDIANDNNFKITKNYNIYEFIDFIKEFKSKNNNLFDNNLTKDNTEINKIEKKIITKKRELKNLYIDEPKNGLLFKYSNELISNFKKDLNGFHSKELMKFELHYCYMLINTGISENILTTRRLLDDMIKILVKYIDIDFKISQIYEYAEWLHSITFCIENDINKAFSICEKAIYNLKKVQSDKLILTRELFVLSKDKSYVDEILQNNTHIKYDIIEEFHTFRRIFEYYISINNKEKSKEMFIKTNSIFKLIVNRLDKIYVYMFYKNVYFFFRLIRQDEHSKLYYNKAIEGFSKYGFIGQLKKLENLII